MPELISMTHEASWRLETVIKPDFGSSIHSLIHQFICTISWHTLQVVDRSPIFPLPDFLSFTRRRSLLQDSDEGTTNKVAKFRAASDLLPSEFEEILPPKKVWNVLL